MSWNPHTNEMWVLSGNKPWCLTLNQELAEGEYIKERAQKQKYAGHLHFRYLLFISTCQSTP